MPQDSSDATGFVPKAVAARVAFSISAEPFTWTDVVRAAQVRGSWHGLHASVRDGVIADAHALDTANGPTEDDVVAATTKFRYDHNLIAGDDLLKWLVTWDVSASDWEGALRRALSRERFASELGALRSGPVDSEAIAAATWPDAVCSGFIGQAGQQLAADVALAVGSGRVASGHARETLGLVHEAADAARVSALTPEAFEREVASHGLEWTGVCGWQLELPDNDMAKEAAMSVRADGISLPDIARACGTVAQEVDVLLADIDEGLAAKLLASREGDLIGPLRFGDMWMLISVERKAPPTLDDPLVLQRAREHIVRSAEERAIGRHLRWHELV